MPAYCTNMNTQENRRPGWLALSPLVVFALLYVVSGLTTGTFDKLPIAVAFLLTCVYALVITRGLSLEKRIGIFSAGAGSQSLMLMLWIFILAGAFSASAKGMGAIDATVNLAMQLLPGNMLMAGLFLAACFISLSIGTSVGTIVALVPIATGIAESTQASLPLMVGIVVGGAYFGDNLSFISDTTIIATRSQGCKLSDKFKANFRIVLPAALITLVLYIVLGRGLQGPVHATDVELLKVVPYLIVLVAAVCGINVILILIIGTALSGYIGICDGCYTSVYDWFTVMGSGITNMGELIIVTLLAGGLMELIKYNGGIDFIIRKLTGYVRSRRGAELTIAALVYFTNLCTANNTVAIITVGPLAADIAARYGVDCRRSASILDTFSCFAQAVIPYGAQMLLASRTAGVSPVDIIPHLYYPLIMGTCALLYILLSHPRKYA